MTTMSDAVELLIDFNSEDETGFPWAYLDASADRARIVPGRYVLAGASSAVAVAQVVDLADDGLVHVRPVQGTVEENRHLLGDH